MKIMILTLFILLSTGCTTLTRALRITQEISGTGNATMATTLNTTTASVVNGRKEDGYYKADKLDIVHTGRIFSRIEFHFEDYARPLIGPDEE